MSEWVFTFGHGHVHPVTGEPLHRRFVRLTGSNEEEARDKMVRLFGVRWAFQYASTDAAGVAQHEMTELLPADFPPPIEVEKESQRKNHEIIAVRELRAPYHSVVVESLDPDFMLRFVLVSGSIGDYTVYMGIGPAEWVRDFGNKVPFELAAVLFPRLQERMYRE